MKKCFVVVGNLMGKRKFARRGHVHEIEWRDTRKEASRFSKQEAEGLKHWFPCFHKAERVRP